MLNIAVQTTSYSFRALSSSISEFVKDPSLSLEKSLTAAAAGIGGYLAASSYINSCSEENRLTIQRGVTFFAFLTTAILAETELQASSANIKEQIMAAAAIAGSTFIASRFYRELTAAAVGMGSSALIYSLMPGHTMFKLPSLPKPCIPLYEGMDPVTKKEIMELSRRKMSCLKL